MIEQMSIDLTLEELREVKALLQHYLPNTKAWAYGSRVHWNARPDSDLDLVVFATPEQRINVSELREAFAESNLPFPVDLFVWDEVPEKFRGNIKEMYFELSENTELENSAWHQGFLSDYYESGSGLSKPAKDFGSGFPFLSFKDVFYNYFVPDELEQLVQSSEKERETCSVSRGDVFLTCTSETMDELGMSCVALKDYPEATFNGFTKRLRPKPGTPLLPEYVGYYLRSQRFRSEKSAFSTMSTRASLNNEMISRLKISIPPIDKQKSIAHILKTLDDKMEINRQLNKTLESMAQALFKSWFVDFDPVIDNALEAGNEIPEPFAQRAAARRDFKEKVTQGESSLSFLPKGIRQLFPGRFQLTDDLGWIPKGWEVSSIGEEIKISGGGTPSTKNADFWEGGTNAFCTPKDMSDLSSLALIKTERYLTECGVNNVSSGQLPKGIVLMSSRAPVGYLAVSNIPVTVNQGIISMSPTSRFGAMYLVCWVKENMSAIMDRANGSTFLEIGKKNFRPIPILVPTNKVTQVYSNQSDKFLKKIISCTENTSLLVKIRDTLLPKLLSGELRIPDTVKLVAGAGL